MEFVVFLSLLLLACLRPLSTSCHPCVGCLSRPQKVVAWLRLLSTSVDCCGEQKVLYPEIICGRIRTQELYDVDTTTTIQCPTIWPPPWHFSR